MTSSKRVSRRKKRQFFFIVKSVGIFTTLIVIVVLLIYTEIFHINTIYIEHINLQGTTEKMDIYDIQLRDFFDNTFLGIPFRTTYLLWHTPIKTHLKKNKMIQEVDVVWEWFNNLRIIVKHRKKFAVFCTGNSNIYVNECHILDTEGVSIATGLDTSLDGLVQIIHKNHNNPQFLEPEEFKTFERIVSFLQDRNIEMKKIEVSNFGEYSVILTLHTKDETKIHINPHKPLAQTLFALENGLKHLALQEKNISDVERFHIYDPLKIVYWWKKQ